MIVREKKKNNKHIFFLIALAALGIFFVADKYAKTSIAQEIKPSSDEKKITLVDGDAIFEIATTAKSVGDVMSEKNIRVGEYDRMYPEKGQKIFSGTKIIIQRAKKIIVTEGGSTATKYAFGDTVEESLWENNVKLGDDDITAPARSSVVADGEKIVVTHVQIKEEVKNESIDFKTISNEDDSLGWRIKKTTQKGEKGITEVKYKVVLYDGKEISRKVLDKNKIKDAVDEVVTQGTFVKTGKGVRGDGTWYAFKGGLFAASRTIPKGGFAKVTNMDNGQSVIVQINDYGPQAKERIIDLDKVAFAEIASLGAGVLHNVKVEQVLN